MKKILMLVLVSSLVTGAFANKHKPKKQKQKQSTQQVCTPDCKPQDCCTKTTCCVKA